MAKKARQAYQYEAPVTPSKWTGEEQRFSIRVKAVLEDLYQKFSSLSTKASNAGIVESVNGIGPDEEGNVTLKAENVGAKPASYKAPVDSVNGKTGVVQLTASDVSARPSSWMPTASQVGARPNTWTPSASDVGALPASGTAADAAKLGGKTWAERLLDIYPVGSIYLSINSTSPASLFGGTWEQIKGRFLVGAGPNGANTSTYWGTIAADEVNCPAGELGGEAWHKLTYDQLPSFWVQGAIKDNGSNQSYNADALSGTEWTNHFRQSGWVTPSSANGKYGNDQAHNNMPPYLAVYMWKRVA